VYFITGNANKLKEVKAILEPEIEVHSHSIDLEEIQGSIEEVTTSKCQRAADVVSIRRIYNQPDGLYCS
jgi:inosine triphosphate pyrophosphatase